MVGLAAGRAAMEHEYSAEELEVAQILLLLPRLVLEADHAPPCTHNLRWGARKRRSAGADDDPQEVPPAAAPPPPPHPRLPSQPPPAAEKFINKRSREAAATPGSAAPAPSRKVAKPNQGQPPAAAAAEPPEESSAATTLGTSSPETPLDFCPSAEDAARPPAKKSKLKREQLSKQVDQLSRTRTELQKEAAEIRNRLEALKERNSELIELRIKLEKEGEQHPQGESEQRLLHARSCLDPLLTRPVRPMAAAHAPDRAHPQPQQQQHYQHAWPQHWVSNHIVFHQVGSGLAVHTPPAAAAAAGNQQQWSWAASQGWKVDGDGGGARASGVPDLNSSADVDFPLQSQQQQVEQRRSSLVEQRAARKKRIEMIQKRRNAACGASLRVAGFR